VDEGFFLGIIIMMLMMSNGGGGWKKEMKGMDKCEEEGGNDKPYHCHSSK